MSSTASPRASGSTASLSSNARKQQEDDVERLVKCRIRSEVEARKAAESTMKRAVAEARELKKELMLMRQEKDDKQRAKDEKLQNHNTQLHELSATHKKEEQKWQKQLQTLAMEKQALETQVQALQQQLAQHQTSHHEQLAKLQHDLQQTQAQSHTQVQEDIKTAKAAYDELKRKSQKLLAKKNDEITNLVKENECLLQKIDALTKQVDTIPQLKKQVQHAKEKQHGALEDVTRKLEAREHAIVQQHELHKREMQRLEAQIDELQATIDKLEQQKQQEQVELKQALEKLKREKQQDAEQFDQLVITTKHLQERLLRAIERAQEAEAAKDKAHVELQQQVHLRETAEAAADAVEARSQKLEAQLDQMQTQSRQVEKALQTSGITLEYLLKKTMGNNNNNNHEDDVPERFESPREKPTRPLIKAASKLSSTTIKKPVTASPSSSNTNRSINNTKTTTSVAKTKASVIKSSAGLKKKPVHSEREATPERMRAN